MHGWSPENAFRELQQSGALIATISRPKERSIVSVSGPYVTNAKKLYNTSFFSDLTIECNGQNFHVHKSTLYTQLFWFEAALARQFREDTTNISTLTLDHDHADVLRTLIHFRSTVLPSDFTSQPSFCEESQYEAANLDIHVPQSWSNKFVV
ncbi:hypothetical protein LTR56_026530 [Elasticomyces elasticus]|nr:hypothetical protein LTR56_026530 [Elasticomyces elasticus]KAK3634355.1 hypothetical protein LTR22_019650 [Elasticomyces elasticus]KAK4930457.1 hypothetical protein LTR49_002865 [Elasticomyces elasticus]KAK5745053.1 hypothetical protein LTS12_023245 [Elasticomyces elasticus]